MSELSIRTPLLTNVVESVHLTTEVAVGLLGVDNVGLCSNEKFNSIIGFSGKIIDKKNLSLRIKSKTNILLIHGDSDQIVPSSNLLDSKDFFLRHKINIVTKMLKNCDHHIPIEASSLALDFIKKNIKK